MRRNPARWSLSLPTSPSSHGTTTAYLQSNGSGPESSPSIGRSKNTNSLRRSWQAIEALPSLAAVEAEGRTLVGDEYDRIGRFLRPGKERASFFPHPDGGLPLQVIEHGRDDLVGVCQETGATIALQPRQLVVYRLDPERLAHQVARALGLATPGRICASDVRLFHPAPFDPPAIQWRCCDLSVRFRRRPGQRHPNTQKTIDYHPGSHLPADQVQLLVRR